MTTGRSVLLLLLLGMLGVGARPGAAGAHAGGHAFVLLLPTHLYVVGGALVVAASFALVALLPARTFPEPGRLRWRPGTLPLSSRRRRGLSAAASLLSLAVVLVLIAAGVLGSRDPLSNPLPLVVWTLWWVGFTYLHALLGNLWAHLNPWSGLHWLVTWARGGAPPPFTYPAEMGHWPAVALFLGFAWFELVYPAPADPAILAGVVSAYLLLHVAGVCCFGVPWLRHAEPFSVFFRIIGWLAPLGLRERDTDREDPPGGARPEVEITLPGLRLLSAPALVGGGVAFVLAALSAVSFDGLSRTFTWVALLGENPLEYPGRTAVKLPNTIGLLGAFAVLGLAYLAVVRLAGRLAGDRSGQLPGRLVLAVVPIAFGYHFAHYLPVFIVDVQYAIRAVSDPFARGWDLLGTRDLAVVTSFLTDPGRVYAIWHTQVAIIVVAHVVAVYVAHALALRLGVPDRAAVLSQAPMLALMIGYTLLGLWLLATPAVT